VRARLPLLGLLVFLAGCCILARRSDLIQTFELKTLDWRFQTFSSPATKDPGIVLLMLDQQSLDQFEKDDIYWPWPRSIYEAVLSFCKAGGARAVVFDVLFTSPSPYGRSEDEILAKALKKQGKTVLAMSISGGKLKIPVSPLRESAALLGDVAAAPDPDGVFRRVPLTSTHESKSYPTLAAAAVLAFGGEIDAPLVDGKLLIRYRGARAFPSYPLGRVIQSWQNIQEKQEPSLKPEVLKDKLVMIGYSAPGLMDLRPTPVAAASPGTEVVAAAAANLLNRDFLLPAAEWLSILLILLAALAGGAASIPLAAAGSLVLAVATILAFRSGTWLEMVAPQLSLWLSFAASAAYGYATEGRKKREIHRAFSHYLSPHVVDSIAADPSKLKLGGERAELSCYFSDIEGFTSFSEKLSPERLTNLMNRYLGEMTDTVLDSGGTLDKYIGDAVMAFWGAPVARADHAVAACKVALENQRKLVSLRKAFEAEGFPPVRARIGLNSGTALVGNLGSKQRFSYTALGDDINLASRLEGANKVYGTYILISHATREQAGDAIEVRELDMIQVKGKAVAVRVYELLGLKGETDAAALDKARRFEAALSLFRARKFAEAKKAFEAFGHEKAAELYVERCDLFISENPPEGWNGSFALTEK
jgi:adenylate cyclase